MQKVMELNPILLKQKLVRFIVIVLRTLLIIGLSYLFLFPVYYMIIIAFQSAASATDPSVVLIPKALSLDSIKMSMKILEFKDSSILTATISVFSTIAALISCSMVGYGLSRFKFFGQNIIFALTVLTIIVPPQTILMSSYLNFRFFDFGGILSLLGPITGISHINLLNTPWTFILPSFFASGLRCGLFIYIFRQFFLGMPKDLEEAAKIDGCGALKTFIRIIVPLAVPTFVTVMLFSFVWHWNDFYSASMYFTDGVRPVMVMLNSIQNVLREQSGLDGYNSPYLIRTYVMAGALLSILPPLLLYVFTQKYFTESIERTGIVG